MRARRAVLKRIRAIAALPVLFALCASGIVLLLPDRYEASVTIQIDPRQKLPVLGYFRHAQHRISSATRLKAK